MKLKRILISLLIILTGSTGLLFGCNTKSLKLNVQFGEEIVESIELKLPIDSLNIDDDTVEETPEGEEGAEGDEGEEIPGDEDDPNEDTGEEIKDESKAIIKVVAENANSIFNKGLDISFSENNIVKAEFIEKGEDGYIYEISALYPKNVVVTFTTKDRKVSTSLNVVVTQDLNKIEANVTAKNYVVLGENKEISTNIINFTPSTTTNKNITFELVDATNYQGISIVNNRFVFTDTVVTYYGQKTDRLYVNAIHEKYAESLEEEKSNFIVESIAFDILAPISDLAILVDGTSVDNLSFATNSDVENLNYKTIEVKQKVIGEDNTYIDIDSSYEVKYYFKNDKNDVVSVEQNGNTFVISQNFRDDECTIVFYAQNKIQPSSEIKLKEINISVITHPSYITVNGERNPSEIILYDNGTQEEIEIIIGPNNAYNKNFVLTSLNEEYLELLYQNGTPVTYSDIISSGTKLLVKHSGKPLGNVSYNTASLTIKSEVNDKIEKTITFRIVESLKYEDVLINSSTNTNIGIPKIDINGDIQLSTFTITALDSNLYIPNFTVDIENTNILSLVSTNNNASPKNFVLKSLSTGTTTVTLTFDNGLQKSLEISVYMPVSSFKIDVEENSKTNLGEIVYRDGELDSLVLKINKTAKLQIKAYDGMGHLINDVNLYTISYSITGGDGFIAISNIDNLITANKETTSEITVTATITAVNQNGNPQVHTKVFDVEVYVPVEKVTISESYFSLYTKNNLGKVDENLSMATINFKVEPSNATALTSSSSNFKKPSATLNFDRTTAEFESNSNLTSTGLNLKFTALNLEKVQSYIGTISFTIQEFGIVYNKKATIKITKPVTPEKVLLDNVSTLTDEYDNSEDYLYFNLGFSSRIKLNPRVYPLDSYNLNYNVEITNQTSFGDPVKFDKQTGEISAIKAGECTVKFTPIGVSEENKLNATKTLKVIVADGSLAYPYKISTKEEFLSLCSTEIVTDINTQNKKYEKHYRLINDIDLSGEYILPIGMYITKQPNTTVNIYNFREFTGSFDGRFEIGSVANSFVLSGLSILKDFGDLNVYINSNNIHYGLFGINSGTIKNLKVYYNHIDMIASAIASVTTSVAMNSKNEGVSFYFGGIAGMNNNSIENCEVNIYSGNIITYFGNSFIGLIAGKNNFVNENDFATLKENKVSGNLNILDGVSKYNVDYPSNAKDYLRNILAGSIVGQNDGNILDKFNIYNQDLEIFNKDKISSKVNLTSIYNNTLLKLSIDSAFGGVVGLNNGTIGEYNAGDGNYNDCGISSFGSISAYNNVGGIAGINNGNIYTSFTASTLYANSNIGGLIGQHLNGTITNNAVMFLSDGTTNAKITGNDYVGGLIGKAENFSGNKNFVKSYINKENYYDIEFTGTSTNFGALYSLDSLTIGSEINGVYTINNCVKGDNFANFLLKTNDKVISFKGEVQGVGIIAPERIEITINNSTLKENTVNTFNKFIKADNNSIILYYYNNNSSLNEYLLNTILIQEPIYPSGSQQKQQLSLIQIESLNKDILTTNEFGKLIVNKTGNAQIKIYSMLNENAFEIINVKVIDAITNLNLYLDSLSPSLKEEEQKKIRESQFIEKGESINLYLDEFIKQEDIYLEYQINDIDSNMLEINAGAVSESFESLDGKIHNLYKAVNAQVIKGLKSGTVKVTAKLYVRYFDFAIQTYKFKELPSIKEFNLIIKEGLKNIYSDIQNATLVTNSSIDAILTINTDLLTSTNIHIEQIVDDELVEYLNIISEKTIENNLLNYNLKISLDKYKSYNDIINKVLVLKIYAYDSLVDFNTVKDNANGEYNNYIKILNIKIEENNLINLNMSYFADGEVVKDENGNDIINTAELESNNIKIGKVGILKINVYPIENLSTLKITYSNADNLNLSFKQVRKFGQTYEDVNTSQIINKGIILDVSKTNIDENYVYLKLLTESPIEEGSVFTLKAQVNNLDYYFEKNLTSKLATNLELSYSGAILNSNGILEGVYAKGMQSEQIISLRVSKLNGYDEAKLLTYGKNTPTLKLISEQIVSSEEHIYNFVLEGLIYSGNEYVELYFYKDKVINGKTEKYISNTLKLNIVDFVVNSVSIENVADGYLTKPYGTNYELKVKLNTTNNGESEVLNTISRLEEDISKGIVKDLNGNAVNQVNTWFKGNESLVIGDYGDFAISKLNGYYVVSPKTIFKGYNLFTNFAVEYNSGKVLLKELPLQNAQTEHYIENGNYSTKFNTHFGLNFYLQTDINNPVPVYTMQDFVEMQENANYILMNDLILGPSSEEKYKIQNATFNSFDGNGYSITIKNLDIDISSIQNEFNFGLFSEISENSIVKNLNVKFDLDFTVDSELVTTGGINLLNISNLNFGAVCAINNGLIYNCSVLPYKVNNADSVFNINISNNLNGTQTLANIGGLVGINNGIITNSRSNLKLEVNKGFVGGFVASNSGTISSSYYKNSLITNLGEDETTSTTAGFVNINSGIIKYSYVEGEENFQINGMLLSNNALSDYCIKASTGVGGFVYSNSGEIEDCYTNLSITSQSFSGGFVYTNAGIIKRCYSACENEQDSDAHAPFIATKIEINETQMKERIINCFYLDANKSTINDGLVTKLSLSQMNDEYYLTNFIVNLDNGIWKFRENLTPTLIEANNIAFSQRSLYSSYVDSQGSTIYNYIYDSYYMGHEKNPIIISSEEEFISYFTVSSQTKRNSYYYRLINNINFSEYSNLPTINYTFSGRLDGNGLQINNISISAPSNFNGDSFGLFAKIERFEDEINPIVKNLKITPTEVYANNIQKVGTLAGSVNNGDIINVEIDANGVIVQGKNIVGGLVGEVAGDSKIINITSSISVNASFSNSSLGTFIYNTGDDSLLKINENISYAGSVCGVINTNKTLDNNENVRNITVLKGAKAIAEFAGLAFGLICDDSGVDNVKVYVNSSTYLNSLYSAGFIAGENRGYISRSETIYTDNVDKNLSLFKNTGFAIGGIVGFNNNGTIVNSVARVSVIGENKGIIVAGGVVGMSVGGSISSVIATNKVYSNKLIGGIIGLTASREMLTNVGVNVEYYISLATKVNPSYKEENYAIKKNNIVYIANTIALNDFDKEILENKTVGAIIGGVHNSEDIAEDGVSLAVKNSYIAENNYYLPIRFEKQDTTYYLKDFGALNYQSIDGTGKIVNTNENKDFYCAKEINSSNYKILFERFSSSIFTNLSTELFNGREILRKNLEETLLPQIQSTNNINTKSLEGQGTFINPYKINSIFALNQLAKIVDSGKNEVYVNLTDNLEVTGKEIESIGANLYEFNGTFNGNNKFINGLTYINDMDKYSTQNLFGLFGVIGSNGYVSNLNVVANFVINYGSNVNYTGAISGINNGLISNCNVYGGIVGLLKNVNNNALSYVGGIAGMNSGNANRGIENSNNYSIIYISVLNEGEIVKENAENINIYAGFIAGANINKSAINKCSNFAKSNIKLNSGAGSFTLIVINSNHESSTNCNNFVGNIAGYSDIKDNVVESETTIDNIYSKALSTKYFIGKSS